MSYRDIQIEESNIMQTCPYCGTETNVTFREWGVNLSPKELEEFDAEGGHYGIVCHVCNRRVTEEELL